jgi:hypothetical protein
MKWCQFLFDHRQQATIATKDFEAARMMSLQHLMQ